MPRHLLTVIHTFAKSIPSPAPRLARALEGNMILPDKPAMSSWLALHHTVRLSFYFVRQSFAFMFACKALTMRQKDAPYCQFVQIWCV